VRVFITFVISRLTEFCNFSRLLFSLCTETVSSAKSIVFMKLEFGKSFINIKKTKGLKLNPGDPRNN